jgi:hypothetical protein
VPDEWQAARNTTEVTCTGKRLCLLTSITSHRGSVFLKGTSCSRRRDEVGFRSTTSVFRIAGRASSGRLAVMEASHRKRAHEWDTKQKQQRGPVSRPPRPTATVPQTSQILASSSNKPSAAWQRLSTSSTVSASRLSSGSNEEYSTTATRRLRPSALPRSTTFQSGNRVEPISSSRQSPGSATLGQFQTRGSESLHSATDARPQPQPTLRRKYPSIKAPSSKSSGDSPKTSFDTDTDSLLGFPYERQQTLKASVAAPNMYARSQQYVELPPSLIPELQALAGSHARPSTAQGHSVSSISSPSTQHTESPEPWSSRNTTPMSMSSYSPGIVQPLRINQSGKRANTVPLPTNTRSRTTRLPVLQETLTSSSSSEAGREQMAVTKEPALSTPKKQKRSRIDTMEAPTPPPRSASVKRGNIGDVLDSGIGFASKLDDRHDQDRSHVENSPLTKRSSGIGDIMGGITPSRIIPTTRGEAAEWQSKPTRPSRSQVMSLEPRHPTHLKPKFDINTSQTRQGDQVMQPSRRVEARVPNLPNKSSGYSTAKSSLDSTMPTSRLLRRERPPSYTSPTDSQPSQAEIPTAARPRTPGKLARLGAFIRGKKTPEPDPAKNNTRKLQRKGPVAGTGHEGYGKYAKHSKKFSLSSGTVDSQRSASSIDKGPSRPGTGKTSTSTRRDSKTRTSQSDMEEFVAQRLKPVHITGGSGRSSGHHQAVWSTSETASPSVPAPSHSQQPSTESFASGSNDAARGLLIQGADASSSFTSSPRLIQRPYSPGFKVNRSPEPNASKQFQSSLPYLQRTETPQSFVSTSQVSVEAYTRPIHVMDEDLLKKQDKKGRKLKWNIFSRGQSSNKITANAPKRPVAASPEMPVRISAIAAPRSVPYYAMIESESENNISDMGEYFEQFASPPPRPHTEEPWMRPHQEAYRPPSTLLPSFPVPGFPDYAAHESRQPQSEYEPRQETQTAPPSTERPLEARPRRLAQVGRIPMVVSRKDRRHTPNAHSFSRPFQPGQDQSPRLTGDGEFERPHLEIHTELLPARPFTEVDSGKPASAPPELLSSARDLGISLTQEYMAPIERQVSQVSNSTSEEGQAYVSAPVRVLHHAVQRPPSRYHGEDEVWNEYDDFLDHVMSPSKSKRKGKESHRDGLEQAASSSPPVPQRLQDRAYDPSAEWRDIGPSTQTPAIVFPEALDESRLSGDIRLRRSRIISALHSSIDPSSPFSVARFFAGYADSDKSSVERLSVSGPRTSGFLAANSLMAAPNRSSGDSASQPDVVLFDVVEKERDPAADNELHYASLMISRWLSFGHVLFSPAQDDVCNNPDRHILVLDGLRNDDFSYYCCVTFKTAYVHSLKEVEPRRRRPSDSGHAPPNYRTAEVSNFAEKFPFPPTFFSVVVLRFLPAMSDRTLQNLITEAKRVLAPGGHLELMLLDLDIVNMGTNTRRAIREMKIKITNSDSSISLKPISDNIQAILGRKGFAKLNRCVVGVPVAGKIAGSMDSSGSSRSSGGSYAQKNRFSQDSQKAAAHRAANPHIGENFSLNDLISDHTPGSDEKIAKIVSTTARFWFSHCYESQVTRGGKTPRSILSDRKVLNECKMRASSFKLLIAHTQKPNEFKRRTVSEPMLPTLATAGARSGRRNFS